jgi:hypothetical protein
MGLLLIDRTVEVTELEVQVQVQLAALGFLAMAMVLITAFEDSFEGRIDI